MDFGFKRDNPNKTPAEIINEGAFEVLILEIFILVLIANGIEIVGKNLIFTRY